MTDTEQEQFPHFFSWLQRQNKRASSALRRCPSNTAHCSSRGINPRRPTSSATASRPRSKQSGHPGLQLLVGQQQQQQQQQQRPESPGPLGTRKSCSGRLNRPHSPSALPPAHTGKLLRPASAAPSLLVTSHQAALSAHQQSQAARPFSAVPSGGCRAQLNTQQQHILNQQQQHHHHQQQGRIQHGPMLQCAGAVVCGHRPKSPTWATLQQRGTDCTQISLQSHQQHQQQEQALSVHQLEGPQQPLQQPSSGQANKPTGHLCCAGSACMVPTWLKVHPTDDAAHSTAISNSRGAAGSGSSCGPAGRTGSRPSSPLAQALSRFSSRPGSPTCLRPCSRAAAAATAAATAAAAAASSHSSWGPFRSDAPILWQHASTSSTQLSAADSAAGSEQMPSTHLQQQQQHVGHDAESADRLHNTSALLPQQQQQQQLCSHQAALQLFRQLPLRGAASHASVTREVLQTMSLGLQLQLQQVGAPCDLLPPADVMNGSRTSSNEQRATGAGTAITGAGAAGVAASEVLTAGWSAAHQVGPELALWQQLTAELCRQAHVECSQRGQLLQAAMDRQQQLLQQAMCCCDTLHQAVLDSQAAQQQQQEQVLLVCNDAQAMQQECSRLKGLLEVSQSKLLTTAVELEQLQERMRRGRFHLVHEQVQEARIEIEKRVLRDMEAQVFKERAAAEATAESQRELLLNAIEEVAGPEVATAVLQHLKHRNEVPIQAQ